MADAKRKASSGVRKPKGGRRPGGPGGNARDQWTKEDITDLVAVMMDDGISRRQMCVAVGKWMVDRGLQAEPTPLPAGTLDDYIRRAKDARAEVLKENRQDAAKAAERRMKRIIVRARAAKKLTDEIRAESVLAELQGTKAVRKVALTNPAGDRPLELKMPKTTPTSDDLRRELASLLEKSKGGKQLARALADVD
jgi:hypothetical protein